jgi:predicted Zn-dependent peptidase
VAVVGDVKTSEVMPIMAKYFGRLPKAPAPDPLRTIEPKQAAERSVILHEQAQPVYFEAYHRPAATDPDAATFDAIEMLLSEGRTSRLYRSLVRDKKLAAVAAGFNGFPGQKYPNLFAFFGIPTAGHTASELADPIHAEIERLKADDVSADDLQSIKTRTKAKLLMQLDSNSGLAIQLATYQTVFGDWRELFREVDKIDKVTAADIKRVANATFTPTNRTTAMIESVKKATPPSKGDTK